MPLPLGNSGASVLLTENLVVKVGGVGLLASAAKQRDFLARGLLAPPIYGVTKAGSEVVMVMERVTGWSPHDWPNDIRTLLAYVRSQYEGASPVAIPATVLLDKLDSVLVGIAANPLSEQFRGAALCEAYLREAFSDGISVHVGATPSHGDLTLCNVLSTADRCYLVDFSTPFLDVPLNDLIKLRQDTRHRWCLALHPNLIGGLALRRMDEQAGQLLASLPDRQWYQPLATLNLLRLLPYAKTPSIYRHVLKELGVACTH